MFWKPADGSGAAEQLTMSENIQSPTSWSSDGQRFVMIQIGAQDSATQIHVVLNWFEELKQRAPTGN